MDDDTGLGAHWDAAYGHGETTRSWYQAEPVMSLRMLDLCDVTPADKLVEIGGGASALVDSLLHRGHNDVTVIDVSANGLAISRERLGNDASRVNWHVIDVLGWRPGRTFTVWHDRAVFHFLVTAEQRARYLHTLNATTEPGALAVFATFAADGPETCSGLPVARYQPEDLARTLGRSWSLVTVDREEHPTPSGGVQPFMWTALRRR